MNSYLKAPPLHHRKHATLRSSTPTRCFTKIDTSLTTMTVVSTQLLISCRTVSSSILRSRLPSMRLAAPSFEKAEHLSNTRPATPYTYRNTDYTSN
jgi:hypothetical protein